ncbi:hypothetical protein [Thorsellia anophelis]|uniref:hypothetical protein n=1 Tax=Thorsellia anophelis TaxID=336804 RepID=UPI000B87CA70|nr:hypothetical protein [Thorsellia anophelis]
MRDPEQTEYTIAIAEMHRNHILDETRQVTILVNDSIDKSKRPYSLILKNIDYKTSIVQV